MKVKSNLTFRYRVGDVILFPGINYVTDRLFLKHPHVKIRMQQGLIEILDQPEIIEKGGIRFDNYKSLPRSGIRKKIKDIDDIGFLEGWLLDETRSSVRSIIKTRMRALEDDNR